MLKIPSDSDITEVVGQYVSAKTYVKVSCASNHIWEVLPSNLHHKGTGKLCPVCAGKETECVDGVYRVTKKKTTARFKEEIADLTKDIEVIGEYTGANNYVRLKCPHGHEWRAIATNLLTRESDRVCGECNPKPKGSLALSIDQVATKIPECLSITRYINTSQVFDVLDTRCGHTTEVWYANIAYKGMYRCGTCHPGLSNQERELREFISEQCKDEWVEYNDRTILDGKELDIVLPNRGIAIEYNGSYWHSSAKVDKYYHLSKLKSVEAFGYSLLHIDEMYWSKKRDIIKSRILQALGKSNTIYARNTVVKEIPFPKQFLEDNHLQGAGAYTTFNYGLFLKEELVAVMTFSKPRFTIEYEYELVRYCSKLNTSVVGGASKLLKAFGQRNIVTYADRRFSRGNLYEKLGFIKVKETEPGYYYVKSGKYLSRYQCQKAKLQKLVPEHFSPELSESEIMRNAGFHKVYDAGNLVYAL